MSTLAEIIRLRELNPLNVNPLCVHDIPNKHLITFSLILYPLETDNRIIAKMNTGKDKYFLVKCPICNEILTLGKRGERARE